MPIELEPYVKKLNNSRRRVMLVNSILQNVQVCLICLPLKKTVPQGSKMVCKFVSFGANVQFCHSHLKSKVQV